VAWVATCAPDGEGLVELRAPSTGDIPPADAWAAWVRRTRVRALPWQPFPLSQAAQAEHDRREDEMCTRAAMKLEDRIRQSEALCVLEGQSTCDESIDAALARELWPLLSVHRANTYEAWRDVGFAMHITSPELLDAWHAFSAQSAKYVPETCAHFWERLDPMRGGLGLGSIVMWAKEDTGSPELVSAARARAAARVNRCVTCPVLEMEHDEGDEVEASHVIDYSHDSNAVNGTATAVVRSPVAVPTTVSSCSDSSARTEHATVGAAFSHTHTRWARSWRTPHTPAVSSSRSPGRTHSSRRQRSRRRA
jgi:Primase C terminal 2 (PriCT-2)